MKWFVIAFAFLIVRVQADSEVRADTPAPLFQVLAVNSLPDTFENGANARPIHHSTIDTDHPLMTVYALKDLLLEPDNAGVRIVFTDEDAATFLKLTQQYPLLCITGGENATVIMKTSGFQGWITFTKKHFTGPMAVYLRKRFHFQPGTNQPESMPPAPSSRNSSSSI